MVKKKFVKCPLTNFANISQILYTIYNDPSISIQQLIDDPKLGYSRVFNARPIMNELGLIHTNTKGISLTVKGKELVKLLEEDNNDIIREFSHSKLLFNSLVLTEAYKILKAEPNTSKKHLGILISKKFETNWNNPLTYISVGRSCQSILGGLHLIDYSDNDERVRKFRKHPKDLLLPTATTDAIKILLSKTNDKNELDFTEVFQEGTERLTYQNYISSLLDLDLVRWVKGKNHVIHLIDDGKKLKNSNDSEWGPVFQNILLKNHNIINIIKIIKTKHYYVDYWILADILNVYNERDWAPNTKLNYGRKLLNWLKTASILEKTSGHKKYYLSESFLNAHSEKLLLSKNEKFVNKNISDMKDKVTLDNYEEKNWNAVKPALQKIDKDITVLLRNNNYNETESYRFAKFLLNKAFQYNDVEFIDKIKEILNKKIEESIEERI